MKLLSKPQIAVNVAKERKAQIDEGIMLATRIDALRETLVNLQEQHRLFLSGMEGELEKKTTGYFRQIDGLKKEITGLEEKRNKLLEPLDEYQIIKEKEEELKTKEDKLIYTESLVNQKETRIKDKLLKVSDSLARIKVRERELTKVYDTVTKEKEEAEELRKGIERIKTAQDEFYEDKEKELLARQSVCESTEFTIKMKEEQLELGAQEIANEKIRLADMRATLERSIRRLKK